MTFADDASAGRASSRGEYSGKSDESEEVPAVDPYGLLDSSTFSSPGENARKIGDSPLAVAASPCAGMLDDYELLSEIARGGMGIVYRARHISLNRIIALKMVATGSSATPSETSCFRAEAESVARLRHPNIVSVHDCGEVPGYHYFTMDLIDGESLAERLVRGPMPSVEAARMMRLIADAVQHAHERQIIHRDLKPANILIDGKGVPHVADFGVAQRPGEAAAGEPLGRVIGTPGFMSPEQADGRPEGVTILSDVYSLGAVLYAMVTGRAPFHAADPFDTLVQVLEREPAPPRLINPNVSADLEAIALKCLRKSPRDRYTSAAEFARDLERFLAGEAVQARRGDALYFTIRWLRNNVVFAGVSTAVAVVLLIVNLFTAVAYRTEMQRRVAAEKLVQEERSRTSSANERARRQAVWIMEAKRRLAEYDSTPEPPLHDSQTGAASSSNLPKE